MAKFIVKSEQSATPQVVVLNPGVNRFGRSAENDHWLDDPGVSEWHCEVAVDGDFIFVRDVGSTNGIYVDGLLVKESALLPGQTLRIGGIEMVLDAPATNLAIPDLPVPENPFLISVEQLEDGFAACLNHPVRHAAWECTECTRVYCDECIRKLGRVGGAVIRLCPACSNRCKLSAWAESMKGKKKSLFNTLADKIKSGLKRTVRVPAPPPPHDQPGSRKS